MLTSDRLTIRNLRAEDAADILRYRGDARCNRYQRYGEVSKASVDAFVREFERCAYLSKEKEQHYALCGRDGGMVGDLTVFYTEKDRCFTLGVTVDYRYQRQGFAYEILSALVFAIRAAYPREDIVALIEKDNAASISLFEKLGFDRECYADSIASYVYVIAGQRE